MTDQRTFEVKITQFVYSNNPANLTALRNNYDRVVQVVAAGNLSYVQNNTEGFWAADNRALRTAHEAGHLMKTRDQYNKSSSGSTTPYNDGPHGDWRNTLMGDESSPVTKDWNEVLKQNGQSDHLFE